MMMMMMMRTTTTMIMTVTMMIIIVTLTKETDLFVVPVFSHNALWSHPIRRADDRKRFLRSGRI